MLKRLAEIFQIPAKLIGFSVALMWILGFLWVGIMVYLEPFTDFLKSYPKDSVDKMPGSIITLFQVWYIFTIILVGAWFAKMAMKIVGYWEKTD